MSRLTTHVLDTAHGKPGQGIRILLRRVEPGGATTLIKEAVTNHDGRCNSPLLDADDMAVGAYELEFFAGDYFRGLGLNLPEPPFVDRVVLRFGIADPGAHYHVPLLVSPWSYSTYRGS